MTRPRDSQRQKVYAAEREVFQYDFSKPEEHEMRSLVSLEETARLILATPKVRERFSYAPHRIKVLATRGRRGTAHGVTHISLPNYARRPQNYGYVPHELAHIIVTAQLGGQVAWHGREYAATMLFMVDYFMGQTVSERLRAAYKKLGVKWRPKRVLSPEQREALRQRGLALATRNLIRPASPLQARAVAEAWPPSHADPRR